VARLNVVSFASRRTGGWGEFLETGGSPEFGSAYGRRGGEGARVNVSASLEYVTIGGVNGEGESAQLSETDLYARWYMKVASLPAVEEPICVPYSSTLYAAFVTIKSDGTLQLYDFGALIGASSTDVGDGKWHMVELRATAGTAGSQTLELRVDGTIEVTTSTATTTTSSYAEVQLGLGVAWSGGGYDIYFADVSLDDSEYPGRGQVKRVYATGPGAYDEWDGDWQDVDEWPATGYMDLQLVGGYRQSVEFPAVAQVVADPLISMKCVFDAAYYNTTPAPTDVLQLIVYAGGAAQATSPTWDPRSTALEYRHGFLMLQTHPTTSLPYTVAQVRHMDVQLLSYTSGTTYLRCQLMALDVEFDPEPDACGCFSIDDTRKLCARVIVDWHSDADGNATVDGILARGILDRVVTSPSKAAAPSANYDVELVMEGYDEDVLQGLLANRSSTSVESVYPYMAVSLKQYRSTLDGKYSVRVSNAGARKAGTVVLYVLKEKTGFGSRLGV